MRDIKVSSSDCRIPMTAPKRKRPRRPVVKCPDLRKTGHISLIRVVFGLG